MAKSLSFTEYQSPSPSVKFSKSFFDELTFSSIVDLDYPTIAPRCSASGFAWSTDVPSTALATLILPNDIIPNALDLTAVIQHLPTAYEQGYRALDITIHMGDKIVTQNFHFSKVCSSLIGDCYELTNLIILSCIYAYLSTIIMKVFLLQNLLWIQS